MLTPMATMEPLSLRKKRLGIGVVSYLSCPTPHHGLSAPAAGLGSAGLLEKPLPPLPSGPACFCHLHLWDGESSSVSGVHFAGFACP